MVPERILTNFLGKLGIEKLETGFEDFLRNILTMLKRQKMCLYAIIG